MMQSRDLREIASFQDPIYRAKSDLLELNLDADLGENLTVSSQTAWNWDGVYSFQDYNRYNTLPIFNDTSGWVTGGINPRPSPMRSLAPGGIFCDPQIGCSDTLGVRSEEHTSELQSLMRISYAVFCLKKKKEVLNKYIHIHKN